MLSYVGDTMSNLLHQTAFFNLTWGNYLMIVIACVFLYLAIKKVMNLFFWFRLHLVCFWLTFIRTLLQVRKRPAMVSVVYFIISILWMSGQSYLL